MGFQSSTLTGEQCVGLCVSLTKPGDGQGTQGNRSACVASGTVELWTDSRPGRVGSRAQGVELSPAFGWMGTGRAIDREQLCALDFIQKTQKEAAAIRVSRAF